MKIEASTSGGIGFCGLLTVVFIALKLTNVIDWSWWWVLSPLWVWFVVILIVIIFISIWLVISSIIDIITQKFKDKTEA